MYKICFMPEVFDDLDKLPKEVLKEVKSYFNAYKINPFAYSQPLQNKFRLNLSSCRKTYVANATYRIILQVENKVAKVVCIIAVGKREDLKAYKEADLRIKSNT
ncbi:type II toxin-antitoxin system RelE family toxin [Campylobacter upsaliensis]|uniref:type II toxin-antitoxin system RelE family toxin n=1 Tax=Campylobacter upsaliensis TaxID=28080 RepID=UPI00214A6D07|nr:hypothetical protein [Campylobacter upsaliensis]MCR2098792.1 hypothetical protein [Campylobacter upsaliensis]